MCSIGGSLAPHLPNVDVFRPLLPTSGLLHILIMLVLTTESGIFQKTNHWNNRPCDVKFVERPL